MKIRLLPVPVNDVRIVMTIALAMLLSACNVNVKKDANGKDKNVQIDTPVASLHVSNDAKASDTGLPVYPGSTLVPKEDNGNNSDANLNIQTGFFGLKVVAVAYESDDSVEKVKGYYQSQLKKYGNVLECRSSGYSAGTNFRDDSKSETLTCEQSSGNNYELKSGIRDNQRIVSIEPRDKGCKFTLVYVQMHGKETTI
jgi:hypothetical protein